MVLRVLVDEHLPQPPLTSAVGALPGVAVLPDPVPLARDLDGFGQSTFLRQGTGHRLVVVQLEHRGRVVGLADS